MILLLSILNALFCISFVVFAYLNLNDVDPWLWVPIYMVAAICCGFAIFNQFYPNIYLGAISFYLIYAIILFFFERWGAGLDHEIQKTKPGRKHAGQQALHRKNERVFWFVDHQCCSWHQLFRGH